MGLNLNLNITGASNATTMWTPLIALAGETPNLWVKENTRNGFVLPDTINPTTGDAAIYTPAFIGNTSATEYVYGNKTRPQELLFDGGSYTIYFKLRYVSELPLTTTTYPILYFGGGGGSVQRGMFIRFYNNRLRIDCGDEVANRQVDLLTGVNALTSNLQYYQILITIDYDNKIIRYNAFDNNGSLLTTEKTSDISEFVFNNNQNLNALFFTSGLAAIADFKKFSSIKTLEQCISNTYEVDIQLSYPDIISGTDVSANALHLTTSSANQQTNCGFSKMSNYMMEIGHSIYYAEGLPYISIPYNPSGNPITRTITDYAKLSDYVGNALNHNLANSMIEFAQDVWDRSNTTIWNNAARMGYYDANNPKRWNINELNQQTINDFFNVDYKNMGFVKILNNSVDDRIALLELFSYDIPITGNNFEKAVIYTNDYDFFF